MEGDAVLLTANSFIYHLPPAEGRKQEYGLLCRTPTTPLVQKYVALALALFQTKEL